MTISTTAFGVYFYLIPKLHGTTGLAGEEPHTDLAWLALASMAVFITGEILTHRQLSDIIQAKLIKLVYQQHEVRLNQFYLYISIAQYHKSLICLRRLYNLYSIQHALDPRSR